MMYLNVALSPSGKAGEARVAVQLNLIHDDQSVETASLRDIPALNGDYTEQTRLELWIVAAVRNALTAIEADMFARLTGASEKLTLSPWPVKEE